MNEHETDRIAAAMHHLRPDWPVSSIRTIIRKHLADRPRRDVAVALAWIACEPNTHTPARVLESGPWWKAAGIEGNAGKREPFDRGSMCGTCGKSEGACRSQQELMVERRMPDPHEFESVHDRDKRVAVEKAAREELG